MLLAVIAAAWGHGVSFGSIAVSVAPDGVEAWAVVDGWGLVHSTDGGGTWTWHCEEALGEGAVYDVLALGDGRAAVASRLGVLRTDGDCALTTMAGLPDETYATTVVAWGDAVIAGAIGPDAAGVVTCDEATCTPTDLWADGLFPKSLYVDGGRVWATTVEEGSLASALWRSDDGVTWTEVYDWPDGDVDPRVLEADGDRLWVWRRARDETGTPGLLVSDDGGASFDDVLDVGVYTDPAPGYVRLGDVVLVGSVYGARTWRSDDAGRTWTEVSTTTPAVRCGERAGDTAWVCGDHLNDGFDLAVTTDGAAFTPVACLEDALPAACAEEACQAYEDAWDAASAYGGGQCDVADDPPSDDAPDEGACGCGHGGAAAILLPLLARRRR